MNAKTPVVPHLELVETVHEAEGGLAPILRVRCPECGAVYVKSCWHGDLQYTRGCTSCGVRRGNMKKWAQRRAGR